MQAAAWPERVQVLIAGGGPVGLTLAALLARYGVSSTVIEADASYCTGSRAICMSRRSQEIFAWIGADKALVEKGLLWVGGRSYWREQEVLHFQMPSEPSQRFAPMLNIQQYCAEEFAHRAALAQSVHVDVRWSSKVVAVQAQSEGAQVHIDAPDGRRSLHADWLIACDGGRSTVREQLGLQLEGMQYEGRYVIVDIVQKTKRPVERLAWFDPPSNPGSTLLMHRQPGDVWRIDYQIRDDEDAAEAIKPENVWPRVQSHLTMIGETEPWEPLWISIYNAKCLTLPSYRHGRVLFAGDAAHLVPIFGVRGLNSGLDDAGNLAWKLAAVLQGGASDALLGSYSSERVQAARENMAYGAKSTEFMAPPHYGFKLLREAALRLAVADPLVRSLINPRQSSPVDYAGSELNFMDAVAFSEASAFAPRARPGLPAPEALLLGERGSEHLTAQFGACFLLLHFTQNAEQDAELKAFAERSGVGPASLRVQCIAARGEPGAGVLIDAQLQATERYDAHPGSVYLVRPDGYVAGRWRSVQAALDSIKNMPFGLLRANTGSLN